MLIFDQSQSGRPWWLMVDVQDKFTRKHDVIVAHIDGQTTEARAKGFQIVHVVFTNRSRLHKSPKKVQQIAEQSGIKIDVQPGDWLIEKETASTFMPVWPYCGPARRQLRRSRPAFLAAGGFVGPACPLASAKDAALMMKGMPVYFMTDMMDLPPVIEDFFVRPVIDRLPNMQTKKSDSVIGLI